MTLIGINFTEAIELKAADRRAALADIRSLGITDIRCEFPWMLIGPTRTKRSWAAADALMADADATGLRVLGMVVHPPKAFLSSAIPSAADFGLLMGDLAKRYRQITAWEIWNEENLHAFFNRGDPTKWVPYLQAGYKAIKAVSTATVVLGGLAATATHSGIAVIPKFPFVASYTNTSPTDFLTGAYKAGAKGYFDVLGVHPYCIDAGFRPLPWSATNPYIAVISDLRQIMANNADAKPIWATEFGFSSKDWTQLEQANYLRSELTWLTSPYIAAAFAYCYRDNNGENYGIIDAKNTRKQAYTVLANR